MPISVFRSGAVLRPLAALGLVLALASAPEAQTPSAARQVALTPVADGLYLLSGEGGNVAAYVTGEEVGS